MLYLRHKRYTPLLFLFAACIIATNTPSALAAPFTLPENAVIEIHDFSFPAAAAANAADRDFQGTFHNQMEVALQRAGFSVFAPQRAPNAPAASAASPVVVSPLTANESDPPQATPESLPAATKNVAEPAVETHTPAEPVTATASELPQSENSAPEAIESPHESSAEPQYILTGNVTLMRENVGAPTRIAGAIRVRTESALHCTYKILDAATGKVLVSDTASGSVARVTAATHDIDGMLATLSNRAMATTATKIAANLSGRFSATTPDENYQDSPGKRLKPKK